jgi:RNA polymerase sigma-70 factor (ECF subfamily)
VPGSAIATVPDDRANESDLIARVLAGDRNAARALYDLHAPRVHRLCYRVTGDGDLADDCTQEAFIQAFRNLDRFRGDSALTSWLHRIAMNVAINGSRRARRWRAREADLSHAAAVAAPRDTDHDLRERLARAIDELPETFRLPVVLHDVEGFTHAEIAELLGVPEGTCKTRLMKARARLRDRLTDLVED